jgi:hypothetical protein
MGWDQNCVCSTWLARFEYFCFRVFTLASRFACFCFRVFTLASRFEYFLVPRVQPGEPGSNIFCFRVFNPASQVRIFLLLRVHPGRARFDYFCFRVFTLASQVLFFVSACSSWRARFEYICFRVLTLASHVFGYCLLGPRCPRSEYSPRSEVLAVTLFFSHDERTEPKGRGDTKKAIQAGTLTVVDRALLHTSRSRCRQLWLASAVPACWPLVKSRSSR